MASALGVLGYPANGEPDVLALRMLGKVLEATGFRLEILPAPRLWSEVVELIRKGRYRVVCIGDLPPSAPSKSLYLVKRLRAPSPT